MARNVLLAVALVSKLAAPAITGGFTLTSPNIAEGRQLSSDFVFLGFGCEGGKLAPTLEWSGAPDGTKSFAVIMHDTDVPSSGEDVNQEGKVFLADLPRVDFYHWVLGNLPTAIRAIPECTDSPGVTSGGNTAGQRSYGNTGINTYTDWFAGGPRHGG